MKILHAMQIPGNMCNAASVINKMGLADALVTMESTRIDTVVVLRVESWLALELRSKWEDPRSDFPTNGVTGRIAAPVMEDQSILRNRLTKMANELEKIEQFQAANDIYNICARQQIMTGILREVIQNVESNIENRPDLATRARQVIGQV